jgi:homopolymeric O-antigen transport system permease protein
VNRQSKCFVLDWTALIAIKNSSGNVPLPASERLMTFFRNPALQTIAMTPQYGEAVADLFEGIGLVGLWGRMGWAEIKRRYRRTVFGPFWSTLSLAIFVGSMGFVWATLFKIDPKQYLPYLASGMLTWVLFTAFITEGCMVFIAAENLIKQQRINYTMLLCAMVWRNLITFAHNIVVYVPVYIYGGLPLTANVLMAIPGLVFLCLNGMWIALVLGILCARYRDMQQVVATLLQVSIFVTPIFWSPAQLTGRSMVFVNYNLLYHYVEIVRDPLLGQRPSAWSWFMVAIATVVGWSLAIFLFSRFRRRIPYWL